MSFHQCPHCKGEIYIGQPEVKKAATPEEMARIDELVELLNRRKPRGAK